MGATLTVTTSTGIANDVEIRFTSAFEGIDYNALVSDSTTLQAFSGNVKSRVASRAGPAVTKDMIKLAIREKSARRLRARRLQTTAGVIVDSIISIPGSSSVDTDAVQSSVSEALSDGSMDAALVTAVTSTSALSEVLHPGVTLSSIAPAVDVSSVRVTRPGVAATSPDLRGEAPALRSAFSDNVIMIGSGGAAGGFLCLCAVGACLLFRSRRRRCASHQPKVPPVAPASRDARRPYDEQLDEEDEAEPNNNVRATPSLQTNKAPAEFEKSPSYWKNRDLHVDFPKLEPVSKVTEASIQSAITATHKAVFTRDRKGTDMPTWLKVVQVQRVESLSLWRKYARDRYAMKLKRHHRRCTPVDSRGEVLSASELSGLQLQVDESINETLLWHGTSLQAAQSITKDGFDLSFSGANGGSMYGKGFYFAECSSKSDEYARDSGGDGFFCLLLCRVVLGEPLILTTGGAATHSMIREALKSGCYDTVLGDRLASVGTFREFVAYEAGLVYPEYLVTYKREFGTPPPDVRSP
jgi:hypothetical protein